jgi:hypothetical protein
MCDTENKLELMPGLKEKWEVWQDKNIEKIVQEQGTGKWYNILRGTDLEFQSPKVNIKIKHINEVQMR